MGGFWRFGLCRTRQKTGSSCPQEAVKALSGIGCSYGRKTCMNAVAEALRDVLDQVSSQKVVTKQARAS